MNSDFFETNNYYVDKKNGFQEHYHIYNDKRERIGRIKQELTFVQKLIRLPFTKNFLPFFIEIRSANGGLEATILRTGSFFHPEIVIQDAKGKRIGVINKNNSYFNPEFKIIDTSNKVIAQICDVWKKCNFIINDSAEKQIGSIDKKWGGAMKNIARSEDSYNVSVMANYTSNEEKIAILSTAIAINMIFLN